jgi:hypothetical protein
MSNIYGQALSLIHITVGASFLLTPTPASALFSLPPIPASAARSFGSRDLALGYAVWVSDPHTRRSALMIANLVNALDVVTGLIGYAQGELSDRAALGSVGMAAIALGLGVLALR